MRSIGLFAALLTILSILPATVSGETIYFNNKRTIEARSYEIKGSLIYITLNNGTTVYMRADTVDWVGTEQIGSDEFVLEKVDYAVVDYGDSEEDIYGHLAKDGPLTAADLKKARGFRSRAGGTSSREVEVGSDLGWVDTRMTVQTGQRIQFRASGEARLDGSIRVDPLGRPGAAAGGDGIAPSHPHGALLMRLGLGGDITLVGRASEVTASMPGRIYLAINDKTPEDNSGSFLVRVKMPSRTRRTRGTVSSVDSLQAPVPGAPPGAAPPAARRQPKGKVGSVERSRRTLEAAGRR